ncbi:MAG: hypothetical protein V2J24_19110 [Pseudomonadales bacterium]|nr:hypothetical protein [Pseudomonadales bacterium]
MSDSSEELRDTAVARRDWVMMVRDDQIASVVRLDAFLEAIRKDQPLTRPRIRPRRAIFALAEPDGVIRAACAFTLTGDEQGRLRFPAIPLRRLAMSAPEGPDLGWGPIPVACAAQCPDPAFEQDLWGLSSKQILAPLLAAQGALLERLRRGDGPATPERDQTGARIAWQLPDQDALTPEQLEHGRRVVAAQQRAGEQHPEGAAKLRLLEDANRRYREENARLRQELLRARRQLGSEAGG